MTTVRKTAKTTVTLIILATGLALLMRWCGTLSGEFFYKMEFLLNSKTQIGGFHSFLIRVSFWLLLIASGIEAVYREKTERMYWARLELRLFSPCVLLYGGSLRHPHELTCSGFGSFIMLD